MSNISIIVAIADDRAIGKDQGLLWHMPVDMKRFKALTTGHTIVMGRKTYESLPKGGLPNRKNIVLTSQPESVFPGCFAFTSLQNALESCQEEQEVFIIGGSTVYQQALGIADTIYLTQVHATFPDADTHFPEVDWEQWEEIEHSDHPADEKNPYPYSFVTYQRKR